MPATWGNHRRRVHRHHHRVTRPGAGGDRCPARRDRLHRQRGGTATLLVPAGTAAGSYPVTLTATNTISAATQPFTLTVGTAPAITSAARYYFEPGGADFFNGTATGSPAPSLTETGAPAGVTFTDLGNGKFLLSVPLSIAEQSSQTYTLTITAANGVWPPAVQYFALTVGCPPGEVVIKTRSGVVCSVQ